MKTGFAAVALFITAALAVAVPEKEGWYVRSAEQVERENLALVDLEVTSDLIPGVVFTGTAESIYYEMKAINPASVGNTTPVLSERSLAKRSFNCGWGAPVGSWNYCIEGVGYLKNLGSAWCGVGAAPACARVSCSHGCGMYLCNKLNAPFRVFCGDIAKDIHDIAEECGGPVFSRPSGARDFSSHFIGLGADNC